jgi:hypothetical protein
MPVTPNLEGESGIPIVIDIDYRLSANSTLGTERKFPEESVPRLPTTTPNVGDPKQLD